MPRSPPARSPACGLREAAERLGDNTLLTAFRLLLDRAEAMTRAALKLLPQGTSRQSIISTTTASISTGASASKWRRRCRATAASFDLTGTSPQVKGPVNCVPSGSLAAACFAVRAVTDPTIPNNGGCFRPISLRLPPASLVNPARAGAGQCAHRDDQAHHQLHADGSGGGRARARPGAERRAASGDGLGRSPTGWRRIS